MAQNVSVLLAHFLSAFPDVPSAPASIIFIIHFTSIHALLQSQTLDLSIVVLHSILLLVLYVTRASSFTSSQYFSQILVANHNFCPVHLWSSGTPFSCYIFIIITI